MTGAPAVAVCDTAGPIRLAEICDTAVDVQRPSYSAPIWFSALIGAHCLASANGELHVVRWHCVSGRAQYTNFGPDAEMIEPLGVQLEGGHTLAVSWAPGQTGYTLEVFRALDYLV